MKFGEADNGMDWQHNDGEEIPASTLFKEFGGLGITWSGFHFAALHQSSHLPAANDQDVLEGSEFDQDEAPFRTA
jgi:hypothetical protein